MNKILREMHFNKMHVFRLLVPILLFCSCKSKNNLFYYSGNQKIEFVSSGDTLGFLLKDTVLNAPGDTTNPVRKIQLLFDSSLNSQGYDNAGSLTADSIRYENVRLRLNKTPGASLREKERTAQQIKRDNRTLIAYSGYLVRSKNSGKPFIVTDEIIIEFNKGLSQAAIDNVINNYSLEIRRRNPFVKLQFTVAVTDNSPETAIIVAERLRNEPGIRFAQINLVHIKEFHSVTPADEYFSLQWHHLNNGTDPTNATEDADIDADSAWNFTRGAPNIIVAVFDQSLDVQQEDLRMNFSHNLLERPWNNNDDDANLMVDDTVGWNFIASNNDLYPASECVGGGCFGFHGTAVMGLVAAQSNTTGVTGVCPECNLIPIRTDPVGVYDADGIAFAYARTRGARIFLLCWSYDGLPESIRLAINDATGAGILVFVSMSNSDVPDCSERRLSSLANVFAVSRSNSQDKFDFSGRGDCLDLLAPSGSVRFANLLRITTTDVMGDSGMSYLDGARPVDGNCPTPVSLNYTTCFDGTSSAAPLVAGTAGLILSANPMLNARQVQNLLQDCADKIDTIEGGYSPQDGRSTTGKTGYGRLNAYEAVKIASPDLSKGGRNGVDIFLRDNRLDWGNTEKPSSYVFENPRGRISHWTSMDIKVDAPPYEPLPAVPDNHFFETLPIENPIGGRVNKVYVRVRNRGFTTAGSVIVNLYWVHAGATLPSLPADFWTRFPLPSQDATTDWNSLGTQPIFNLEYSGASIANTGVDAAQIVSFDFTAPVHNPATRNHYCLMVIVSSPDDRMPTAELMQDPDRFNMDYVTTHFNNATHKNYNIETADAPFSTEFYIYNPELTAIQTALEIIIKGQKIPVILSDSLQGKLITLNVNEKKRVRCTIDARGLKEPAEISIQQMVPGDNKDSLRVIGGITYFVVPPTKKSTAEKKQ